MAGSKMTIGDIKCYYIFATLVYNDAIKNKPLMYFLQGKMSGFPKLGAWVKVMDGHFASYFAANPKKHL